MILIGILILVAGGALTFKSWWNSEQSRKARGAVDQRLGALETKTEMLRKSVDSLRTTTRVHLDSVKVWVNNRARKMTADQEEQTVDMAKEAWRDARSKLPKDLADYERKVAT